MCKLVIKKKGFLMEWEKFETKHMFRRVITNTFVLNEDCEMFIMVLKSYLHKATHLFIHLYGFKEMKKINAL